MFFFFCNLLIFGYALGSITTNKASGGDGALSQEGSLRKREISKHQETLSCLSLWQALEPQRAT